MVACSVFPVYIYLYLMCYLDTYFFCVHLTYLGYTTPSVTCYMLISMCSVLPMYIFLSQNCATSPKHSCPPTTHNVLTSLRNEFFHRLRIPGDNFFFILTSPQGLHHYYDHFNEQFIRNRHLGTALVFPSESLHHPSQQHSWHVGKQNFSTRQDWISDMMYCLLQNDHFR